MVFGDRPRLWLQAYGLLALLGVAALPPTLASAVPVPAAESSITFNNGTPITTPGLFTQGGLTGEIETDPAPFASAHVGGVGTSSIIFTYWFRINGPTANAHVPIQITGRVQISAGGSPPFEQNRIWGVTAGITAQSLDGPLGPGVGEVDSDAFSVDCSAISEGPIPMPPPIPSCSATVQDEPVLLTLDTLSGGDNRINLVVSANNMEQFVADFDATADPIVSFAPGFDATGYSIELSDGVGNTVPESSAALMTGAGAGLLLALRRRK